MTMFSCVSTGSVEGNSAVEIKVDTFSEQKEFIKIGNMLAKVDSFTLTIPDSIISYSVEDACILDDNIYILDQAKNIIAFNLTTEKLICSINATGKGHGEYLTPMAITSDQHNIYILDMAGMAILSYDKNLKFKKKINLSFPCIDFEKLEFGFLLYNLNANNDLGKIVIIDNEGKKSNDFLRYPVDIKKSLSTKHIFQKLGEFVCIIDPYTSAIYKYDDNIFEHIASLTFKNEENKEVKPISVFMINNVIIAQYLSKFVMTSIYDNNSGKSYSGFVKISGSHYGFMPITQNGKCLYGIYPDLTEGVSYHLIRYHFR